MRLSSSLGAEREFLFFFAQHRMVWPRFCGVFGQVPALRINHLSLLVFFSFF